MDRPELLKRIFPVVNPSFTEMRKFPAGVARNPDREEVIGVFAPSVVQVDDAISVVPSHSFALNVDAAAVSLTVTVPLANQMPTLPCATLGPSKKFDTLLSATSPLSELVIFDNTGTVAELTPTIWNPPAPPLSARL